MKQDRQARTVANDAEQRAAGLSGVGTAGLILQTGTLTLVAGVSPAVPAAVLPANAIVALSRVNLHASTAIAEPLVTITPNTSFIVTSTRDATLATETGDVSTFNYAIIVPG